MIVDCEACQVHAVGLNRVEAGLLKTVHRVASGGHEVWSGEYHHKGGE